MKRILSYLKEYFDEYIFPTLTPLAIDAYRPFPMLSNKSLNLFVVLGDHENASNISSIRTKLAIVGVPSVLKRYIELPTKTSQRRFVLIEDVISFFIKSLFNGFNVESVTAFRITRNSDLTVDEEDTEDILLEMEEVLKARKRGATVRLEIQTTSYNQRIVDYLVKELEMMDKEVYFIQAPLDLTFLFSFYKALTETHHHLMYEPYTPQIPKELIGQT